MSRITITGFEVGERAIQVGYSEHHDRGEHAVLLRQIMIERELVEPELAELLEILEEMVDKGLLDIQAKPDSFPFRERR